MNDRIGYRIIGFALALALLCACDEEPTGLDGSSYQYAQPVETDDGWATTSLSDAGLRKAEIGEAVERIKLGRYERVHGLLIVRDGKLAVEEYFRGQIYVNAGNRFGPTVEFDRDRIHNLASVTKSVTSALTGLAIEQGFIDSVNDSIHLYLPDLADFMQDQKKRILVKHLLTMTSGWTWSENTDMVPSNDMYQFNVQPNPLLFLVNKGMAAEPGDSWVYNGGAVTLLGKVIENASGMGLEAFSKRYLFEPLGITDFQWPYIKPNLVAAHGDLKLRPRDMAKIGQLYLDGGLWQGRRLLSEEWVNKSVERSIAFQDGHLLGYAYLWWLRRYPMGAGEVDAFFASGWGGQRIIVMPELDMVVVLTGGNYESPEPVDEIMERHVIPAVIR